jgi:aminoglycoside phosphotransferase
VDFRRRRPSAEALAWVERELGARVAGFRRMTGGIIAAVHRLTVEYVPSGRRKFVVLRQYEHHGAVEREAAILRQAAGAGLPAPRLLAASAAGIEAGGHPSVLMTRLPGRADLSPADPGRWLDQMADVAARIHAAAITAPAYNRWVDPWQLTVPATASQPRLWSTLARVLRKPGSPYQPHFIHRDFQHFNLLWSRARLTGVADWGSAGRRVDPWWDLHALASYNDSWPQFIPVQVNGRALVDVAGMTGRVEEFRQATLRRL